MLDQPEQSDGKINWPMAIGLSVVVHVIVLGFFWMVSGPSGEASPDKGQDQAEVAESPAPQPAADGGEVLPSGDAPARPVVRPVTSRPSGTVSSTVTEVGPSAAPVVTYTVMGGDNLTRIARKHGWKSEDEISEAIAEIRNQSKLTSDSLAIGQKLQVPVKK